MVSLGNVSHSFRVGISFLIHNSRADQVDETVFIELSDWKLCC